MKATSLNELKNLLSQQTLYKSHIVQLMSETRRLLEIDDKKPEYSVLNFYCNWSLHSKLDSSTICYEILEKLTDMLMAYDNRSDLALNVSEILSISKLRGEFILLFGENNLPIVQFTLDSNWKNIFMLICYNLIDRPIEFPSSAKLSQRRYRRVRIIYDSIINRTTGTDYMVKRFALTNIDGKVHWNLNTTSDFINLRSPLYLSL